MDVSRTSDRVFMLLLGKIPYQLNNTNYNFLSFRNSLDFYTIFSQANEFIILYKLAPVMRSCLTLHVVNLQVLTSTGSQSQCDPTQVPPAVKNFSLSQKEKTLDELVRDQWLNRTPDGIIGLGVRSFLDLRSYFRNNDIPSCQVCNEAGVKVN